MNSRKNKKPVFIDPIKRIVMQKGALSALLVTGSDKVENGFGNGDCLLLDFSRLVFAVSDGSERYPNASGILLERFSDVLPVSLSSNIDGLQYSIGRIYKEQKYTHKCTFSCVALVKNKGEVAAFISSGGDSAAIVADSSDGSIVFKTASDMNFAGRSNKAPGISTFGLKNHKLRIILATDGCMEALNRIDKPEYGKLPEWLFKGSSCRIAEKFLRRFKAGRTSNYDDTGMIILDPFAVRRDESIIITGGTMPAKETMFASSFTSQRGRWLEKKRWPDAEELFDSAGILIKDKNK